MAFNLSFSYPDGHVEEIEQPFASLESAVRYGENLYNQVRATELMKKQGVSSVNMGAYFLVEEVTYGSRKIVFDSRVE